MIEEPDYYRRERPELVARVPQGARRVLDIGCGAGVMSAAIRRDRKVGELWGMELVPEMAAEADRPTDLTVGPATSDKSHSLRIPLSPPLSRAAPSSMKARPLTAPPWPSNGGVKGVPC